jgi:hypothetical protein
MCSGKLHVHVQWKVKCACPVESYMCMCSENVHICMCSETHFDDVLNIIHIGIFNIQGKVVFSRKAYPKILLTGALHRAPHRWRGL